jgi:hypothetical protein
VHDTDETDNRPVKSTAKYSPYVFQRTERIASDV